MTGETFTLMLLAPLAYELGAATQELLADLLTRELRKAKVDLALNCYALGGMSFGAAAQQAGVSQADLGVLRLRAGDGAALLRPDTGRRTELSAMTTVLCNAGPLIAPAKLNRLEPLAKLYEQVQIARGIWRGSHAMPGTCTLIPVSRWSQHYIVSANGQWRPWVSGQQAI